MRRVKNINIKIGMTILLFSIFITLAFVGLLLWFQYSAATIHGTSSTTDVVYPLSNEEISQIFLAGSTLSVDTNRAVNVSEYQNKYLSQVFRHLLPFAAFFCIFLVVSSFCLWLILKQIQNKETSRIVDKLNKVTDYDSFITGNPALVSAYENIKQKFTDNLNDYKRLNSYLSHEQKNAIAILRTNLELNENTTYFANLDYISDSIDDILTLSETLDISGKSTVDVSLVCAAVCDSYRKLSDNIAFEFDEDDNTEIIAKERWIYRAVSNLLSNAVKYGAGKPITVSVRSNHGSVIVTVKDEGIGIPCDKQEQIFNHRYRINELGKDGYGIGLSLVSHVCDLCGGFAIVESEENCGSKFYLSFPQKLF